METGATTRRPTVPPPQPPQEKKIKPSTAAAKDAKKTSTNPFLQCAAGTPAKKPTKKDIGSPLAEADIPMHELPSQQSNQRSQFEASMAALNKVGLPGMESLQRTYSQRGSSQTDFGPAPAAAEGASNTRANLQALIEHDLGELNKAAARLGLNEVWEDTSKV